VRSQDTTARRLIKYEFGCAPMNPCC